jgi:hypothetical protein
LRHFVRNNVFTNYSLLLLDDRVIVLKHEWQHHLFTKNCLLLLNHKQRQHKFMRNLHTLPHDLPVHTNHLLLSISLSLNNHQKCHDNILWGRLRATRIL